MTVDPATRIGAEPDAHDRAGRERPTNAARSVVSPIRRSVAGDRDTGSLRGSGPRARRRRQQGMPRALVLSISVTLLLACGGGKAESATGSESSSEAPATMSSTDAPTTGSATTGSTGDASTSTSSSATTGSATGGETTGIATTGHETTGVETTGRDTTGSETTGGAGGEYAAFWWSGGLNHVIVRKLEDGRCTTLSLAWPIESPPEFMIEMPSEWAVQAASINPDQGECLSNWKPPPETVPAKGGAGTVAFVNDPMLFCPKTVDVDVVLNFAAMPDIPTDDVLQAVTVPVQDCG